MKKFIALVLSLVMALSLCVPAWGAAEVTVSNGSVTSDYTDLATAIANVDAGGTVKVLSDITLANSIIEVSSNVTIEAADPANPVTITTTVEDAFKVVAGGKLTLGEGLIINGPNTILFVNGGSAVIDGAELNLTSDRHNSGVYVYNGSIEFKDGAINGNSLTLCVDAGSSAIVSGGSITSANESALAAMGGSNVTISGSAVLTSEKAAAYATGGATITVDGGTLTSTNSAALIAAKFTESTGGTVIMNNGTVQGVLAHEHANAAATITGGTVTGNVAAKNGATASVTGGTFATDVSAFAGSEAVAEVTDGNTVTYIVGEAAILDAINDANEGTKFEVKNGSVQLTDGVLDVGESITITPPAPTTYAVTFDANGGTGTMATATLAAGVEYTLPACTFTAPEGKEFDAWSVGGVNKAVGDKIPISADTVVTALWKDKAPAGGGNDNGGDEGGNTGTITPPSNWWPIGGIATEDKPIESPKTFDAGVVLYVGMSVAAAVGAVTLSKKRED